MTRTLKNVSQTFFLLGATAVVIFLFKYNADSNFTRARVPLRLPKPRNVNRRNLTITINSDELVSKCEQNMNVTNMTDFSSLPDHLKDFLYYQHCRYFPKLLDVPDKCGGMNNSDDVFLLLVIKSSPENYERREVLRKTWAKERSHNGVWIRRIFISGTSGEGLEMEKMNKLLDLEHQEFSDILQWDFSDTFYNLTLKQMLFLQWLESNCPNVRFLFNGDDDVFAHTSNIVDYLQSLTENDGSQHLFTGFLFTNEKVVRWPPSKYYIPTQIQKEDQYLPYCGGGGYILSGYTALVIYKMSQDIPLHPIDDAYMGMCLAKAGLSPSSHIGVKTLGLNVRSKEQDDHEHCFLRQLLVVHRYLPPQIDSMWKRVHDRHLKCPSTMILK
ncbi:N-acetyllactosaminide beta-1,3-N-acetylglucosaminyltransferase 3-like [Melanotaenia boesemani]|uniref:N-acetyllactosaminide beta-1,3-N-acetylglucosaminyltransferase 3-like n=1 Tax=Melanotaenia boesemani TaxID=1250792 RepID=UPI001C047364|nr:N-acetyllactosaminide beta-1,3-N-acetylglucosaminyltransferase 3-like [Melanotaenia boesemani]XP_041863100.1 N-acetyllactosaminide beta-1,3-N-acetylglucosaminyltransferase 3-like [Melanotaenia boesemani]